jgi:hypothetical protein
MDMQRDFDSGTEEDTQPVISVGSKVEEAIRQAGDQDQQSVTHLVTRLFELDRQIKQTAGVEYSWITPHLQQELRHQKEVNEGIGRFTRAYFGQGAMPPGLLHTEYKPKGRRMRKPTTTDLHLMFILGLCMGFLFGELLRAVLR